MRLHAPAVSVVLPFHNARATLTRAVESIQAQTLRDIEILCIDDGSEDDGADAIRRLAVHDARIRLISPGRVGLVGALQIGCSEATAPYIARMDADDVSYCTRLEAQTALLGSNGQLGLCGVHVRVVGPRVRIGLRRYQQWINTLITPESLAREIYVECPIAHPAFLLRRSALEGVGGYVDHGWAEDYDLVLRMHAAGWGIGNVPEVLLRWFDSGRRLSRTDARYSPEAFRACKRHYLLRGELVGARPFYQWGAGEVGKPWLREWGAGGPVAVVDINARKIGTCIHGYRVIAPEELAGPGAVFFLIAVGAPGARRIIRSWCSAQGYVEGHDYFFIA